MNKNRWLRLLAALLVAALLLGALLLAARKAYGLYTSLSKKADYANNVLYTVDSSLDKISRTLYNRFDYFDFDYSWLDSAPPLIAHAFGGVDGVAMTNSLEAFQHNYERGYRVFEVDLTFPAGDYTLIASHGQEDWIATSGLDAQTPYTYQNFMDPPSPDRYTTMNYRDVVDLMIKYPDIYIVTDTKHTDCVSVLLQFSQLVKYAKSRDASVLDRLIPQIYHEEMLSWVMSVHLFKSVIYTLYQRGNDPRAARDFCEQSGVRFITAPEGWINPDTAGVWNDAGITIAAHTVNDPARAKELRDMGVDALYTDFLSPSDF